MSTFLLWATTLVTTKHLAAEGWQWEIRSHCHGQGVVTETDAGRIVPGPVVKRGRAEAGWGLAGARPRLDREGGWAPLRRVIT